MSGDRKHEPFDILPVVEDFTTSEVLIRPQLVNASVPMSTIDGLAGVEISNVVEDDEDTFRASAFVTRIGQHRRNFFAAHDLRIRRDNNAIRVGSELSFDPEDEQNVIRSKKLWVVLGVVSVTLTGIKVTRSVMRARRKTTG